MRSEIVYDQGPKGMCEVRLERSGKTDRSKLLSIRIVDLEDGNVYEIPPENSQVPVEFIPEGKPFYYKLNAGEDTLYNLRPYGTETENVFVVQHKWIPHAEDEMPSTFFKEGREVVWKNPKTGKVQKWWDPEMDMFNVEMTIVMGKYKGLEFRQSLGFLFREDGNTGNVMLSGKGKPAKTLETYLKLAGFDFQFDNIGWHDGDDSMVLYELDELLGDRADTHSFQVKIAKGWPKEFFAAPDF